MFDIALPQLDVWLAMDVSGASVCLARFNESTFSSRFASSHQTSFL